MPYKPLGDDKKIHDTHMPPTFTVHTYSSNFGGATFGPITDASEHGRTQSVLRMGRSFSTRMSSQGLSAIIHWDRSVGYHTLGPTNQSVVECYVDSLH